MLAGFALRKLLPIAGLLLALVGAGWVLIQWGEERAERQHVEEILQQIENTSKSIQEGLNEVNQANPTGDAAIARDRLRSRQENRNR